MREEVLHYIWENRLYDGLTLEGKPAQVLSEGQRNSSDGPDFTLAQIKLGDLRWAGSVEIHKRASDWQHHGHHLDPNYNGVILHVVLDADAPSFDSTGREVPTALLEIAEGTMAQLSKLQMENQSLRCMPEMMEVPQEELWTLIRPLLAQRLERKLRELRARSRDDHLNTIFFLTLMRYMGALKNNDAMEQVAQSISYSYLKKHANDTVALEAMLLGQAGFISDTPRDAYEAQLLHEYQFYWGKFGLTPPANTAFKRLRVRPSSYPTRRLAIIAQIIHREDELLSALTSDDVETVRLILSTPPSPYWQEHLDFGQPSPRKMGGIGTQALETVLINAIVPTAYYYAQQRGDEKGKEEVINWLSELPAEQNSITKLFTQNGLEPQSAGDSQALLELYDRYCTPYGCLRCPLAAAYFAHIRSTTP